MARSSRPHDMPHSYQRPRRALWGRRGPAAGHPRLARTAAVACLTALLMTLLPGVMVQASRDSAQAAVPPALVATPTTVVPGQHVAYHGSGFGSGEAIVLTWDSQLLPDRTTADSSGAFTGTLQAVPATAGTGDHQLAARGMASGQIVSTTLTVPAPAASAAPATGAPGTMVTVSGTGFGASEPVTTSFDGAQVAAGVATDSGAVPGLTFTVPNPVAAGAHSIVVRGTSTGRSATTTFTATTTASLTLSKSAGPPGAIVVVSGTGFADHEQVAVQFDALLAGTGTAGANGSVSGITVSVPAATQGVHTITARGQQSGLTASAPFTVTNQPVLTLSPASASVGSSVAASASGFAAGEQVVISAGATPLVTTTADAGGNVSSAAVTVPSLPGGRQAITARGTTSGSTASAALTIIPALQSSTASATPGATITVSGTGYAAGERVDILLNSTTVATALADASGAFAGASVTIPAGFSAGSAALTGRGASSGSTATVTVTILSAARLDLSRTTTIAGALLTISGRGLTPEEAVSIQVDGSTVRTVLTDQNGGFTTDIVLPATLGAGSHTITAVEVTTNRQVQASLTVVAPQPRVTQTFHVAGSLVPRVGAPLLHVNGILTAQVEPQTGDFTGHAQLLLSDGKTVLRPAGWMAGTSMRLRVVDSGVLLVAQGAAVSANRFAGAFTDASGTQTHGFWAATRATTTAVVHYAFDARLSSGPDAGTRYAGTLDLLGDTYGGLIGWLRLPGGTVYPVDGQQVNGNVNMLVIVRAGTPFFVVGTAAATGGFAGTVAGPLAGDRGTWTARALGAALPLPARAATLSVLPVPAVAGVTTASPAAPATLLSLRTTAQRVAQAGSTRTFHFAGALLPRVGAPLVYFNGVLSLQPDTATGTFTGHGSLLLSDRTIIPVQGSLEGANLSLTFTYAGLRVVGEGAAVSANRFAGAFTDASGTQTHGFWAATRATTTAVVHYAFDARLSSGPDAGTRYAGTLDLLGDTYGGLIGWLRLPGGTVYPVDGQQVNGNVNMLVIVRAGTPFFVVGTTGGSAYRGNLAGPLAGDQGTWIAAR